MIAILIDVIDGFHRKNIRKVAYLIAYSFGSRVSSLMSLIHNLYDLK